MVILTGLIRKEYFFKKFVPIMRKFLIISYYESIIFLNGLDYIRAVLKKRIREVKTTTGVI